MKNKYNIPVLKDNYYNEDGNFIDHFESSGIYILKRRSITPKYQLIIFGICLFIIKKPGIPGFNLK